MVSEVATPIKSVGDDVLDVPKGEIFNHRIRLLSN